MIGITTQNLHQFDVFHGNNKPERIKLRPSGLDGFFYNGNFIIIQRDEIVQKRKMFLPTDHPDRQILPHLSKLYQPDKLPTGYNSKLMGTLKKMNIMNKEEMYREEVH